MIWHSGRVNPALQFIIGLALVLPTSSQALADNSYRCELTRECQTDQLCRDYEPRLMQLSHNLENPDLWLLTTADGQEFPFTEVRSKTNDLRAYVSTSIDPDASAVSLLTIFTDGQAIMGIHGVFIAPGSVTHLGTCVPKEG